VVTWNLFMFVIFLHLSKLLRHDFWRGLMGFTFFPSLVLLHYANSGGYENKTNWR
jgi:hypothetical protein